MINWNGKEDVDLWCFSRQMQEFFVKRFFATWKVGLLTVFADSCIKKVIVSTFQQRRLGNLKHTYIFWPYCKVWSQCPQICLIVKFRERIKMPKFGTKPTYLNIFGLDLSKNYCHIWNQHPQVSQKWVFNSNSKFWYRSVFSEGLGQGPDPPDKVCIFLEQLHPFFQSTKFLNFTKLVEAIHSLMGAVLILEECLHPSIVYVHVWQVFYFRLITVS